MADPVSLLVMEDVRTVMATLTGVSSVLLGPPRHGEHKSGRGWVYDGLDEFDHDATNHVEVTAKLATAVQFAFIADETNTNSYIRKAHRWQADIIAKIRGTHTATSGPIWWATIAFAHRNVIAVDNEIDDSNGMLGMTTVVWNLVYDFNWTDPYAVAIL